MLTRRKLIMGAVATALVGLGATPALARDERLLADILYGVSDALVRDYIRDRYEDGRWDGHYWYYGGHRYTPHEYGRYWAEDYHRQPPKKPKKRKKPHPHPRDWDDDDDDRWDDDRWDDDDDDRYDSKRYDDEDDYADDDFEEEEFDEVREAPLRTVKFDDFNTITDMSLYEDENFESFVMDEEEEDDMVDDLDDLLSERPKERRSHSEKDDTFQVDYIDLD